MKLGSRTTIMAAQKWKWNIMVDLYYFIFTLALTLQDVTFVCGNIGRSTRSNGYVTLAAVIHTFGLCVRANEGERNGETYSYALHMRLGYWSYEWKCIHMHHQHRHRRHHQCNHCHHLIAVNAEIASKVAMEMWNVHEEKLKRLIYEYICFFMTVSPPSSLCGATRLAPSIAIED